MPLDVVMFDVRVGWKEGETDPAKQPESVRMKDRYDNVFTVRPNTDLADIFSKVGTSYSPGRVDRLTVYAHGYAMKDLNGTLRGGYGLQFGRQDIEPGNAAQFFGLLKGLFSGSIGIHLIGCEIAVRSSVRTKTGVSIGDCVALIQAIADAAGTGVTATRAKQVFEVIPGKGVRAVTQGGLRVGQSYTTAEVAPGGIEGKTMTVMPKSKP